jgi:hypothetical protein
MKSFYADSKDINDSQTWKYVATKVGQLLVT